MKGTIEQADEMIQTLDSCISELEAGRPVVEDMMASLIHCYNSTCEV